MSYFNLPPIGRKRSGEDPKASLFNFDFGPKKTRGGAAAQRRNGGASGATATPATRTPAKEARAGRPPSQGRKKGARKQKGRGRPPRKQTAPVPRLEPVIEVTEEEEDSSQDIPPAEEQEVVEMSSDSDSDSGIGGRGVLLDPAKFLQHLKHTVPSDVQTNFTGQLGLLPTAAPNFTDETPGPSSRVYPPAHSRFIIEEDATAFGKLANMDIDNNEVVVASPIVAKSAACVIFPGFHAALFEQDFPGVDIVPPIKAAKDVSIGYLRIQGKTVKPMAFVRTGRVLYFVLQGTVTIRSCGGNYTKAGKEYLFSKEFPVGACFVIKSSTMYSLENWTAAEALLSYCVVTEEHGNNIGGAKRTTTCPRHSGHVDNDDDYDDDDDDDGLDDDDDGSDEDDANMTVVELE